MSLSSILRPRSIAVVGASPRTFVGQIAIRNCRQTAFTGALYAVNPKASVVDGMNTIASLSALPEVPDVVLVQVATERVSAVVEEGLRIGVGGFIIPGGGHTDSGADATALSSHLSQLRKRHNFEVIGPNCMGVLDLVTGAAPYIGTVPAEVRRGSVGVVAQSGAIIEAVINSGGRVPLSTAVSSGSEVTTSLGQVLDFFAVDTETTAVLAFVETVTDAEATLSAARRLAAAGKRLAVCIVGRSPTACEGIAAHSGKLASGARVTAAAFQQAGAIIAQDLDELLAIGELFGAERPLPRGRRVHVITNSGGEGNLIADIAHDVGLELPAVSEAGTAALNRQWPRFQVRNPLDPWGTDDYTKIYPAALAHVAQESGDTLLVSIDSQRTSGDHEKQLALDLARYLVDAVAGSSRFPVMVSPTSQDPDPLLMDFCRSHRVPLLRGVRTALSALAGVSAAPSALAVTAAHSAVPQLADIHGEDAILSALASLGVTTPRCVRARSAAEAAAAAREIAAPVVLKGSAAGVLHKTELGLVRTNLADPETVHGEAQRMLDWAASASVDLELLVAEMVRGELEVIVGYKRDAVFGPTTLIGLGGVWAEFFDDVVLHVGHLDRAAAAELIGRSRVSDMISRSRTGALCLEGVVTALCAVSALGAGNPDVLSIDINPLIVGVSHATAVDAAVERTCALQSA